MYATTGQIAINASETPAPSLFATIALWLERSAQRRALASLSLEALKDIGLDQAAAAQEAAKPFWVA
jgi:uncharacterized protein YjiS (DUF1127 family)